MSNQITILNTDHLNAWETVNTHLSTVLALVGDFLQLHFHNANVSGSGADALTGIVSLLSNICNESEEGFNKAWLASYENNRAS